MRGLGSYLIKRLLYFIPTFFVLIVLLSLLRESAPDRYSALGQEGLEVDQSAIMRRQGINRQMLENDPFQRRFYFSLSTKNSHAGKPLEDVRFELNRRSWLERHDWRYTDQFFESLGQAIDEIASSEVDGVTRDAQANFLFALGESDPRQGLEMLESRPMAFPHREKLHEVLTKVVGSSISFKSSLPSLLWHGRNNRFHAQMSASLSANWGVSIVDGRRVSHKIREALLWTLILTITSMALSVLLGMVLSLVSMLYDHGWIEKFLSVTLFAVFSIPTFWLATMLIVFFTTDDYGRWTNWFPPVGIFVVDGSSLVDMIWAKRHMLWLPILCLTLPSTAYLYRFFLNGQRDEVEKPYMKTALAKGLSRRTALLSHSFRNAAFPVIGLLGAILPGLIGGALVVEVIFNLPGMGRLMFQGIMAEDWNVVLGVVTLSAVLTFVGFILADIWLSLVDPKVRLDG